MLGRETTWARSTNVFALAANGNYSTLDLLAPFKTDGGVQQGVTITRMHLNMSVTSTVAAADAFSWGVYRGETNDLGANVAGAPTPDTDPYVDWLFWRFETASSGAQPAYFVGAGNFIQWDVKAQRRLQELQMTLNLVVKRQTVAAATLNVVVTASTLLKLP
jgi:hypothetical protein